MVWAMLVGTATVWETMIPLRHLCWPSFPLAPTWTGVEKMPEKAWGREILLRHHPCRPFSWPPTCMGEEKVLEKALARPSERRPQLASSCPGRCALLMSWPWDGWSLPARLRRTPSSRRPFLLCHASWLAGCGPPEALQVACVMKYRTWWAESGGGHRDVIDQDEQGVGWRLTSHRRHYGCHYAVRRNLASAAVSVGDRPGYTSQGRACESQNRW